MAVTSPVPALVMRARRRVIAHLTDVGAISASKAVAYLPSRRLEKNALAYFTRKGVVNLAEGGRYWVDEEEAADWKRTKRNRMALILGGGVAAALAAFAFTR